MLETRAFDGTPEELSDFVVSTWKSSYAGTMAVPNWSADYFRWQLRLDEPESARRVTAVYSGSDLAGVLIFSPYDFEIEGNQMRGAHSSWLSVSPNFRRMGVAKALQLGTIEACQADGADFRIGYIYQGSNKFAGATVLAQTRQAPEAAVTGSAGWFLGSRSGCKGSDCMEPQPNGPGADAHGGSFYS